MKLEPLEKNRVPDPKQQLLASKNLHGKTNRPKVWKPSILQDPDEIIWNHMKSTWISRFERIDQDFTHFNKEKWCKPVNFTSSFKSGWTFHFRPTAGKKKPFWDKRNRSSSRKRCGCTSQSSYNLQRFTEVQAAPTLVFSPWSPHGPCFSRQPTDPQNSNYLLRPTAFEPKKPATTPKQRVLCEDFPSHPPTVVRMHCGQDSRFPAKKHVNFKTHILGDHP